MSESELWRLVRLAMPFPPLTQEEEAAVVLPPSLRDPAAILARRPPTRQAMHAKPTDEAGSGDSARQLSGNSG